LNLENHLVQQKGTISGTLLSKQRISKSERNWMKLFCFRDLNGYIHF
jgi:hypothetical protein